MTNQTAARILTALAAQDPEYETLSREYAAALSGSASGGTAGGGLGVELPADFAEKTLDLLRTDPDTAAKIERYERNLSHAQSYGLAEVETALVIVAALVLLLRPRVDFRTEWDLKFFRGALKVNAAAVDERTLEFVRSVLAKAAKKASEGLDAVAKTLDGKNHA